MQLKFKEKNLKLNLKTLLYCIFVISSHNYATKYEIGLNMGWVFLGGFTKKKPTGFFLGF